MEKMFLEAQRVLNTNGIMIITEVLPSTIRDAIWYSKLSKSLCERYCKLFPTVDQYLNMFEKHAFKCVAKFNILGIDNYANYTDPYGPLKKEWRKGVSLFAVATEQEICDIEEYVRGMIEDGTMTKFVKEHERTLETGLLTIFLCVSV